MADFQDVVNEIKETNKKLDKMGDQSDPSGAAATEEKRESERSQKNSEAYLKTNLKNIIVIGFMLDKEKIKILN